VNVTVSHGLVSSGTTVTVTVHVASGKTLLKSKWVLLPFALSLSKKGTRVGFGRFTDAGAPEEAGADAVGEELGAEELAAGEFDGELALGLEPPQPAAIIRATTQVAMPWQTRYTSSPTTRDGRLAGTRVQAADSPLGPALCVMESGTLHRDELPEDSADLDRQLVGRLKVDEVPDAR
jgi:hypothetical protein